jgi:TetR/AcrR family tetracycline transcriptional repressor
MEPQAAVATRPNRPTRRGRPPKVSRERIVETAGELGLDGLSMQALAAALDVSPGALYRHVDGIDEVTRLVAERKRDDIRSRTDGAEDWEQWLRGFAEVVRAELGGSSSALFGASDRALSIGVGERGLRLLIDAGLTPTEAAHAIWLVVRTAATTGSPDRPSFARFLEPTRELVDADPAGEYRALDRVRRDLDHSVPPDSFPFELDVVIDGIRARIDRTPASAKRSSHHGGDR